MMPPPRQSCGVSYAVTSLTSQHRTPLTGYKVLFRRATPVSGGGADLAGLVHGQETKEIHTDNDYVSLSLHGWLRIIPNHADVTQMQTRAQLEL